MRNTPGWPILEWTVTPLQSVEARAEMEREFVQGWTALKPVQWPHRNGPAYLPDGRGRSPIRLRSRLQNHIEWGFSGSSYLLETTSADHLSQLRFTRLCSESRADFVAAQPRAPDAQR